MKMFDKHYQGPNDGEGNDLGGNRGDQLDLDLDLDLDTELDVEDLPDDLGFDEETDEEREEREAAEAKAEREKNIRIPKSRFDEEVGAARTRAERAEEEAAELRRQLGERQQTQQPAAPTEAQVRGYISGLQDQYEDMLVDGLKAEAREVRLKLEQAREYLTDMKVQTMTRGAKDETLGTLQYDSTLTQIENTYPQLNPNSKDFSEATATEVAELMAAFQATGMGQSEALVKATRTIIRAVPETRQNKPVTTLRQPQNINTGRTSVAGGMKIESMSQEAFAKIDERTLSKARGDTL